MEVKAAEEERRESDGLSESEREEIEEEERMADRA